ncbi:RNA-directed DNA polymerase, eukaryota, reverse transcriptase zinc-binding domain protein [Tanacetum coccineum]
MSKEGSAEKEFTKEGMNTSYANSLTKNLNGKGNQLFSIPTGVNCKGEEVVLFDEEFVKEGSEKWNLIVCGYFVGCRMSVNELKYHTRRMWGSPWIVNGKPLIAQKWDPEVIIKKESPSLILVWMTSDMCKGGTRRLGYARVLVEIDAGKNYVDKVFGHGNNYCKEKPAVSKENEKRNVKEVNTRGGINDEFMEVRNRKNRSWNNRGAYGQYGVKQMPYRNNVTQSKYVVKPKVPNPTEDYDMINYFKYSWEAMEKNENELSDDEDVNDSMNQAVNHIIADEVLGNVEGEFHKIVVGWDPSLMNVMVTHSCKQTMLCLIESVDRKVKFYCSFVYASNSGIERRELWSTLLQHKAIVDSHSWTLMGDFNVILKPEEQSNGPSGLTSDMSKFRDAVNSLEIDDLGSSGFNFT